MGLLTRVLGQESRIALVACHATHPCEKCAETFASRKGFAGTSAQEAWQSSGAALLLEQTWCVPSLRHHVPYPCAAIAPPDGSPTDRRRTKCWSAICSQPEAFVRLTENEVHVLDELYRVEKATAFKAGYSHIQSATPARTSQGKMVGHVRR